ncbi:MAG TPA: O-antigen ligase family protein [Candidatus Saccharimonadales bacterium]|nr:O-antigen ligase family protein [Candidatus Saccharimonadales bacterium]
MLAITGLFLAAATCVRGFGMLRGIALFQVLAALPVAALGIMQHFRPELLPAANSYPGRALGPFGQPNRLGGYVVATIPVAIALAFAAQDRALRTGLLIATFGLVFCLIVTYSRGAWLGLGGGLLVLTAALVTWPELLPRPALLAVTAAALSVPVLLLLPSILARVEARPSTAPAWNLPIDPEREGSGAMRRAIWSGALDAALRRPALGNGIGTFREAFDRAKSPVMKRLEAEGGRTADQAHNHYLGLLAERGALGLAAFAVLTALMFGAAATAMASGTPAMGRVLVAGLAGSVGALLVHGLVDDNLSLIPHGTLLFANLGLLAAAPAGRNEARRSRWTGRAMIFLALVALGVSTASFAGSRAAEAASVDARFGRVERAVAGYATASRVAPWRDDFAVAHAVEAEAWARQGASPAAYREAEAAYRQAIAINGSDPVTRQQLARLYLSHPELWGAEGVSRARVELDRALAQNPYYAEIQNDLGVALLREGNREGARQAFGRAAQGRREFVDPLLNLAALSMESGDSAEARSWLTRALERDPGSVRARALIARLSP